MTKRILLSLILWGGVVCSALALDIVDNGIHYNLYGTYTTPYAQVTYPTSSSYEGNIVLPSSVIYNNVTYPVTQIGTSAFKDDTKLTSVTLPECVTIIEQYAFSGCTGLESVNIPTSVTSIGKEAFKGCSALSSIIIPSNVSSMSTGVFENCTGLTSVIISTGVTSINENTFKGCTSINNVIIPPTVSSISNNAFAGTTNLSTVIMLPTTPPTLGGVYAFNQKTWGTYPPNFYVLYNLSGTYKSKEGVWKDNYASKVSEIPNNYRYVDGAWSSEAGGTPTSTSFVTIEDDITLTADLTIADLVIYNGILIIDNNTILNVTGTVTNPTAANLIIEDGGQIILPEDASVNATVKRSVTGLSKGDAVWEAFASTINNPAIGSTNLITGTYDLYMYDESADKEWVNYKAHTSDFANLTNSRGYLYRNAATMDIAITGTLNTSDISAYTLSRSSEDANLIGFNFVGNPYQMEIYKGVAISNTYLETGYYVLDGGAWSVRDDDVAIAPGAGILVQANSTGDGEKLDVTYTNASAKANRDNIMFTVANSEYSDIAYAMFDEGHGLNKISHRNQDVPMLYIPQNDENFAIAMMSDDTKAFDLNFKAMTTGKYTLSCKTKGNFRYLHVIDRLTGEDVDMLLEDEYSFIGSKNDNENRFIVRLEYSENPAGFESSTFAWQNGSDIIVTGEGELQVFDVMGRRVSTMRVSGETTITAPSMHGVYIFKLKDKTQKIVVK